MRVYVASSWTNAAQPAVVVALRAAGHEVYDFRNPGPGQEGFAWAEIDLEWRDWTAPAFREALEHERAVSGFGCDMQALASAQACVMVQPCGVSAALELGYAAGHGIPTVVLLAPGRPELMLKLASHLALSIEDVIDYLAAVEER